MNVSLKDIPKILPLLPPQEQEVLLAELERLQELKDRKLNQTKFIPFVKAMWPTFIAGRHHAKMAEAFQRVAEGTCKRLIINMPPRHALDLQEEIPTTEGWKTMETVQPGDYVFGPDGVPTRVEGKSPVYEGDLYEVTSIDGYRVVCDADHLWTVRLHTQGKFQTYRTEDLWRRDNGGRLTTTRDGRAVFRGEGGAPRPAILPINEAAQYPHRDLPVDPYVLGVWLGDGTAKQAIITCHDDDARIIRSEIERRGYVTTDQATKFTFGIRDLKVRLRDELGVLGNKHIPEVYLTASVEQRWDLLRGLMDTDGNVSKAGQCVFSQKSRAFIGQVRELLNSLGIKNTFQTSEAKIGDRSYGETYKVSFYAKDCCFLPRKRARTKNPLHHNRARAIRIKKLDRASKVQCLRVAREDGLFLHSRGYLTGHNTKSEFASYLLPAWFLGKFPHKKVIQCSHTAELAVGFGRKVRNLVDTEAYQKVFPDLVLSADSKAAGRWNTSKQGDYFAVGVGGAVTGKGADLLIIDDPHALEVSTPIATPNGFVALGDLKVGDEVFGPDGWPTKVVAKSPVYHDRELFEVRTFDGETIYADAKHLWNVRTSTRTKDPYRNLTTEELTESRSSAFMIPRHSAVQYPHVDLPIDPWVLGAWLGDGTSCLGRMTAHPDDAVFMRGEFKRRGYETTDLADKFNFGVKGLWSQLKTLGVLGNKHIPEQYMTASFLQRMDLLCGLMDTDGNVTASGQCVFHNKDAKLVDQVVELLRSLGRKCQRRTYTTKGKFGTCEMHRVTFKLKNCALMPRKRYRTRTTHDKQHRSITVQKTEQRGSVQCITVEREDGLFLAGRGYVVTHNSEQEAALAEANPDIYDKVYEWYTSGPRQRLQPGGAIVIVMCMVGDTAVLMANGSVKQLKDIRPGDSVASYKSGRLAAARVTNWRSSGVDNIFTVKTRSGRVLRANEDHPFLVEHEGQRKWARLKHLKPGMSLVATTDVLDPRGRSRGPACVTRAKREKRTTGNTPMRHANRWATTVSGRERRVHAANRYIAEVCASRVTGNSTHLRPILLSSAAHVGSNTVTGSLPQIMKAWSLRAAVAATYAENFPAFGTRVRTGVENFVSTMTTLPARFAGFCATTATSLWDTVKLRTYSSALRSIYDVTTDEVVEVTSNGREEVFDIEVEDTENFIANGVVSHNTRWSQRDLTAKVVKAAAQRGGDEWEVIEFPAILPSGNPLWPEFWSMSELDALRTELPNSKWMAQYQQNPTGDQSAIVKREWWQTWDRDKPPKCEFVLQAWDTAFEKTQRADYSACTTWGIFYHPDDTGQDQANIILLNAFRDRMEFPELKRTVLKEYRDWEPDGLIVEKKASGAPLIYELRSMGVPVQEFTPTRGNDKISRLNAVSDLFASGRVWAPDTRWAEEVIDEVASFPGSEHDDYVDTVSMALMRFRKGGYIAAELDAPDEIQYFKSNRGRGYY